MSQTRKSLRLEGIGLLLILASFLSQLIETESANMKTEAYYYETQNKLDKIWYVVSSEFIASPNYKGETSFWFNFDSMFKEWKIYDQQTKELTSLNTEIKISGWIRIIIFIIGSLFIVQSKFMKPFEEKVPTPSPSQTPSQVPLSSE
jgi:hypothetical protein